MENLICEKEIALSVTKKVIREKVLSYQMDNIFERQSKLATMDYSFTSMQFTKLPSEVFLTKYKNLVNVYRLFSNMIEIKKSSDVGQYFISENFFKYNIKLDSYFNSCRSLVGKLSPYLLVNNKELRVLRYLFNNTLLHFPS